MMACETAVRYPHYISSQSPSLNPSLLPELSPGTTFKTPPCSTISFPSALRHTKSPSPLVNSSANHSESKTYYEDHSHANMPPQGPLETAGSLRCINDKGVSTPISIKLEAEIDKGFFQSDRVWTCYRRNYFSCVCSFTLSPMNIKLPILYTPDGSHETLEVHRFSVSISAHVDDSESREVELVQHIPKRDKGPVSQPGKVLLAPRQGDNSVRWPYPGQHIFERVQFKTATANNGKRRAAQQYFRLVTQLFAEVGTQSIKIAQLKSSRLVVRGRSPGHYQTNRRGSFQAGTEVSGKTTYEGGISMPKPQTVSTIGAQWNSTYKPEVPYSSDTEDMDDNLLSLSSQMIIDTIMQSLCKWLDKKLAAIQRTTGDSDHATSDTSTAITANPEGTTISKNGHEKQSSLRRQRRNSDDENPDERDRKRTRESNKHSRDLDGTRPFACPYFKRNPRKYCKEQTCVGPGWIEIHRVKGHLYRRHALPPQCPRCWEVFRNESLRDAHLQNNPACQTRDNNTLLDGFSKVQETQLKSRKKSDKNMTDEDKWREIYHILFPDDDLETIPSPYYDEQAFNNGNPQSNLDPPEHFATFARREFPRFVRRELEVLFQTEFHDIGELIRPRVQEIVLRLQPRLINLYEGSAQGVPSEPSEESSPERQMIPPPRTLVGEGRPGQSSIGSDPALLPQQSDVFEGFNLPGQPASWSGSLDAGLGFDLDWDEFGGMLFPDPFPDQPYPVILRGGRRSAELIMPQRQQALRT